MKRTGEIILGIIGALGYGFFGLIGGFMIWVSNNATLLEQLPAELSRQGIEITEAEFTAMIETMGDNGLLITITAVGAIILGIVAMVLLKGNRKPKASGIIFIVTSVVSVISMGFAGIIAGIFYLIAGIMCLVRKPKPMVEE
ncbi:DUF4064 domain-containing protein [Virgibacillus ainsalahensis]